MRTLAEGMMSKGKVRAGGFLEAVRPRDIAERYREAIDQLRSAVGTALSRQDLLSLENWLIEECEAARRVASLPDKFAAERAADKAANESMREIKKAARSIGRFMRQSPRVASLMMAGAVMDLRQNGLSVSFMTGHLESNQPGHPRFQSDGNPVDFADGMLRLMDQLAVSTETHNFAGRGPFLHNSTIPGMTFQRSIVGKKKPIEHATVLGFHLVFWLRCMTSQPQGRPSDGAPMPQTGQPHYGVADAFVEAALGKPIDCKARLDKHPLGEWQYFGWS